jgi:hypothetical protein
VAGQLRESWVPVAKTLVALVIKLVVAVNVPTRTLSKKHCQINSLFSL